MRVVLLLFVLTCVLVSGGESNTHDAQTCQPIIQRCHFSHGNLTCEDVQGEHVTKVTHWSDHAGTLPKRPGRLQRVYDKSILKFSKWLRKRVNKLVNKLFFKKK